MPAMKKLYYDRFEIQISKVIKTDQNNNNPINSVILMFYFIFDFVFSEALRIKAPPNTLSVKPHPASPMDGRMAVATIDIETSFTNKHMSNGVNGHAHDTVKASVLSAHNINYSVRVATKCCRKTDKQILYDVRYV